MENLKQIPGLDFAKGIEQYSGNKENYLKVLRSYMIGTKSKLDIIENVMDAGLKLYETTVHGIKGASRGICAEELGNKAFELEKAAEAGDIEFINKNNALFLQDLKKLLNGIEEMFNSMDSKIVKEKKDKPDKEVLKKLLDACEIYDMMEVEAAINEISSYQYETDNELAEWLKQCAEGMQYDEITAKLNTLMGNGF